MKAKDLIAHALYLFHARYQSDSLYANPLRICMVDSDLTIQYQKTIHLPFGRVGHAVRRLFSDDFSGIIWLHSDYEEAVSVWQRQDWCRFLSKLEGVYELPAFSSYGRLSDAMRHILMRNGSKEFLAHLKMRHRLQFGGIFGNLHSNDAHAVRGDVSNIEVSTHRCLRRRGDTILPSLSIASLDLLPVLRLSDSDNPEWRFLQKFGVQTGLSLDFFLEQLRALKPGNKRERLQELAATVYKAIAANPSLDRSKL